MVGVKNDYQRKKFKNPYFSPKKKINKNKKSWIGLGIGLLAILFILAVISRNNFFEIKTINVQGNKFISQNEIMQIVLTQSEKSRFIIFSQKNLIFFNKASLKRNLSHKYYFDELNISKQYWNTINISVTEKPTTLIYITNQEKYYLDGNGNVINKYEPGVNDTVVENNGVQIVRPLSEISGLPVVVNRNNTPAEIGNQILNKENVSFILNVDNRIKDSADFKIKQYQIDDNNTNDLMVMTDQGWEIRFSLKDQYSSQIKLLFLILNDKVKDRSTLHYIDLRFGDKIFYQ